VSKKKKKRVEKPAQQRRIEEEIPVSPPSEQKSKNILWTALLLLAVIVPTLIYLRTHSRISPGQFKDYNVLLVTIDTLRADRLPAYGYQKVKTPNLDHLADHSLVFLDTISHAPLTLPSHASILTGRLPRSLGILDNGGFYLKPEEITLAEVLKSNGYATAAFVSSVVLDSRWGLDQGFDEYYDDFSLAEFKALNPHEAQRPAAETETEAERWISDHHEKFFCWVHFYDPHEPYAPPEPYKTEYSDHPYDGEVAYVDANLGKLFKKLEATGADRHTIIVVTSDHGEGLGDHQELTHGTFLYNSTLHVPLLIRIPGGSKMKVPGVVRLSDIAPTILDLLSIHLPSGMQGASLIAKINGKEKTKREALSETASANLHYGWAPLESITTDDYKFIQAPKPELYDRFTDRSEQHNLITEKSQVASRMKAELTGILSSIQSPGVQREEIDPAAAENLRSLGYLSGITKTTEAGLQTDPKDKIHVINGMQQALSATQRNQDQEAIDILKPILKECPELVDGHFTAAAAYAHLQMYDDAIREYRTAIALRPDYTEALTSLAETYMLQNKPDDAEATYLQVLKYSPEDLYTNLRLARLYVRNNEPEKAKIYFSHTVDGFQQLLHQARKDDVKATLHSTLGDIYRGTGNMELAQQNYEAALELNPQKPQLHMALAEIHESKGDIQNSIAEYRKELDVAPNNFVAVHDLGVLYRRINQLEAAAACFQRLAQLRPREPRPLILLATTLHDMGKDAEAKQILLRARQLQSQR
jgi:arylsulfatase A-like enzyme/Tfp pilus assembly protein PilF